MNREQLAHVLRAASQIADDPEIVVIGSQAILGSFDAGDLPIEAIRSMEADVAFRVEPDGASAQIGFTAASAHQGRGYFREAAAALCAHAFATLPLPMLFAITDSRNARSIKLLEAIGFHHAGFHSRGEVFKGETCDDLRFERTRSSP